MKSQDLMILEKLKLGDSAAYKELFDLYYMPLSIYSLKYCDSFDLAEDIVQDLFIKFWDEKIYLKLETAISPYLFKAVKNIDMPFVPHMTYADAMKYYGNDKPDTRFEMKFVDFVYWKNEGHHAELEIHE